MLPASPSAWRMRDRGVPTPDEAYALAVSENRCLEAQARTGYRLFWVSDRMLGTLDVPAGADRYAVVGRHDSCDVVLDDERVVSLRHALVRVTSLDDGCPALSVLDLQSTEGFELSDGSLQRSIAASGPIVFRIGAHSLVALPSGPVPDELPRPAVSLGELFPRRAMAVRIELEPQSRSSITILPSSVDFSRCRSVAPSTFAQRHRPFRSACPPGDGYEVVLEAAGRRVAVRLSPMDLDHGVLIGRSEKCADDGLRSVLTASISRVHLLLLRENGQCRLYDTASMLGTYSSGRRVRCVTLEDEGTRVKLASHNPVTLEWYGL